MTININLGTTNSLIGRLTVDGAHLTPNTPCIFTTHSALVIDLDGAFTVGQAEKEMQRAYSEHSASGFKRLMGTKKLMKVATRELRSAELSLFVLCFLKFDAETFPRRKVRRAVATVPAFFSSVERKAAVQAGEGFLEDLNDE